jgi:iron complex outermembrane recepter protein
MTTTNSAMKCSARKGRRERLLSVTALWASLALVQNAAAAEQSATQLAQNSPPQVDEIVVTATRQSQALSKVPISVAAFTVEKLDDLGLKDFTTIARQTPGVRITAETNNISVRGIASSAGADTTGVYIDETPIHIRRFGIGAASGLPAVFDLERVEVLRGPQGTLFGAGSQGGTVRYITPQPSLTTYSVYARGEAAYTQSGEPSYEAGVATGGPIVEDKLGFRVSAWNRREGGYVDAIDYHDGTIRDKNSNWKSTAVVRGAVTWQPTDALLITPGVLYQYRYGNNASSFWEYYSDRDARKFNNGNPMQLFDRDQYYVPTAKVEYDFGAVTFISNTSYFSRNQTRFYDASIYDLSYVQQQLDATTNVRGPLLLPSGPDWQKMGIYDYKSSGEITNRQRNFTQEVRLQSADPNATFSWVAGVFYQHNKQRNVEAMTSLQIDQLYRNTIGCDFFVCWNGAPPGTGLLEGRYQWIGDTTITDKQLAGFGDATLTLWDDLKLTAGVRVARNDFQFVSRAAYPGYDALSSGTSKETPVTPKFGASYQVTPEHMVYATVAKGFRIGGANAPLPPGCVAALQALGLTSLPSQYKADSVWSYELGSKGRSEDGGIRYEASVYNVNWTGIQQSNYLQACGLAYIDNVGAARSRGFDLSTTARLGESFSLELAVGYTDAKFTKTGYRSPVPGAAISVEKGDALDGVSPWSGAVTGVYDFEVGGNPAYARLNYEFSTRQRNTPVQNPHSSNYDANIPVIPPTHQVHLRVGMDIDNVNVSMFVNNLLDASPRLSRNHSDRFTLLYTNTTFRPRTAGVQAVYRY